MFETGVTKFVSSPLPEDFIKRYRGTILKNTHTNHYNSDVMQPVGKHLELNFIVFFQPNKKILLSSTEKMERSAKIEYRHTCHCQCRILFRYRIFPHFWAISYLLMCSFSYDVFSTSKGKIMHICKERFCRVGCWLVGLPSNKCFRYGKMVHSAPGVSFYSY